MESGLKDIKQHCNDLSQFFYYLSTEERSRDWEAVGEWLEIASGIEYIKFDLSKYDKNIGWCGHADLYADKRDLLFQLFVTEIGFFNFLWGSLEALIDIIDPPHVPQFRGKINNSCNYIKNYFPNKMPRYLEILSDLLNCIQSIPIYSKLSAEFKLRPFVNINGVALFVIYKIRNRLAHGALHFPELIGYEDDVETYEEVNLIRLCSRLVLLSIQMLVASYYKEKKFLLTINELGEIDDTGSSEFPTIVSLDTYMRLLHIDNQFTEEFDDQITFDIFELDMGDSHRGVPLT